MFHDQTIEGQSRVPRHGISAESRTRVTRMRHQLAASLQTAPSYSAVFGTAMKMADVALLSVALCLVTFPSTLAMAVHDPASALALRISVKEFLTLGLCGLFWTVVLHCIGTYDARRATSGRNLLVRLYTGVGICSVQTLVMLHLRNLDRSIILPLLSFFAGSYMLATLTRGFALCSDRYVRPLLRESRRTIIVGTGARSRDLSGRLSSDRNFSYDVVGYVDSAPTISAMFAGKPVLGTISDLQDLLMREHIDEVLIALPVRSCYEEIRQVLQLCESSGVRSQYLSDLFETSVTKRRQTQGDNAERVVLHMVHTDLRQIVKRGVDVTSALIGLMILSPVMLLIAVCIKFSSPGPVFFSQVRYGLNKRASPCSSSARWYPTRNSSKLRWNT